VASPVFESSYNENLVADDLVFNNAAIANCPIANVYFNCHKYFPACDEVNRNSGLFSVTMPIQLMISKSFQPANEIIGEDITGWEAVSPISLASSYSNPVVMFHNTSDILVPVDQITHKYTYEHNDGTLPEGFDCHLGSDCKISCLSCSRNASAALLNIWYFFQ